MTKSNGRVFVTDSRGSRSAGSVAARAAGACILLALVVSSLADFDDGETDLHSFFGPLEVAGFSTHAYTAAGTYAVVGEVVAVEGSDRRRPHRQLTRP